MNISKTKNSNNKNFKKSYIGTRDYFGNDLDLLFYIFEKWRKLAQSYNYQEYINPLVEYANLYKAKSGEDLGGKELYDFFDKGGREIAIRPEATPSITRLVSTFYNTTPKPIRVFSIQNFMRYERPQRGRYREFWQFNIDMFGDNSVTSDFEILKIAAESILVFNPPENSFVIYVNSRQVMDEILDYILQKAGNNSNTSTASNLEGKKQIQKIIDKYTKLTPETFNEELAKLGVTQTQIKLLNQILKADLQDISEIVPGIKDNPDYKRLSEVFDMLNAIGLAKYFKYNPAIVRGIDYYDGIVFEAFDLNPENNRAMFGGGRYNGLGYLFGIKDMPAIGFAPGNATMELFLKNWNLVPQNLKPTISFYLPQLEQDKTLTYYKARDILLKNLPGLLPQLTSELKNMQNSANKTIAIEVSNKQMPLNKALKYALTKDFDFLIILGEKELKSSSVAIKNLKTKKQLSVPLRFE